jgi:hypothetical protein
MIEFRVTEHAYRGCDVVDIIIDGVLKGAIYPDDKCQAIRIISSHLSGDPIYSNIGMEVYQFNFR